MKIDEYSSNLERGLSQNIKIGSPEQPIICLASDDCNGLVRCRVFFWDESYLDSRFDINPNNSIICVHSGKGQDNGC